MSQSPRTIKNLSSGYGYHYASLADFAKQDVKIPFMRVRPTEFGEYVEYLDDGGKWQTGAKIVVPEMRNTNAAQAYGSALTYARRYTVALARGIATDDDDAVEEAKPQNDVRAQSANYKPNTGGKNSMRGSVAKIFSDPATVAQKAKLHGLLGDKYDAVIAKNSDNGFLAAEKANELIAAIEAKKGGDGTTGK